MQDYFNATVYFDSDLAAPEYRDVASGRAGVFSARSPDRENGANEDSAAVIVINEHRGVLALADGMGGGRGGEQASRIAIESLEQALRAGCSDETPLRVAILDAFENANRAVLERGIGAATTLSVLEIESTRIRSYHVGDSPILVVGQRGLIKLQIVPHSPVGYAVKSGVLDERVAMDHDERHLVSNMIGSPDMHIEVGPAMELARYDTVLLASDGLADNLHTEEIVDIIRRGPLELAMDKLASKTDRRMSDAAAEGPSKPDDLTFIVFRRKR